MNVSAQLLSSSKDAGACPRGRKQKLSLACFARILQFPLAAEKILLYFIFFFPPSTHTQTVILMAVRIHCNVVQEEEEVTGRHSMRGGGRGRADLGYFALLSGGRRTSVYQRGSDWPNAAGGFSGGLFT